MDYKKIAETVERVEGNKKQGRTAVRLRWGGETGDMVDMKLIIAAYCIGAVIAAIYAALLIEKEKKKIKISKETALFFIVTAFVYSWLGKLKLSRHSSQK